MGDEGVLLGVCVNCRIFAGNLICHSMVKQPTRKQSGLGIFGIFVIALGLFLGFIKQDIFIAACSVGGGIFLIILSLFLERLDVIIDLLKAILSKDEQKPEDPSKEK